MIITKEWYKLFEILATDPNVGGTLGSITYSLAGVIPDGEIAGTYNVASIGRVIREEDFPLFQTTLKGNQFDLVICTGVLTSGHVGPSSIKELIRLTKPGGYLILSISEKIFLKLGFKRELEKRSNEYNYIKLSKPFIALPNHKDSARSRMHTLQRV